MNRASNDERLVERLVTYTREVDGRVIVVEHVPARVNEETRERFFAPETVEKLQQFIWGKHTPSRVIQAPVFDFAA